MNSPQQPVSTLNMTASGLEELFMDGLKEIYWAELHLVKSLPKMISSASEADLKTAIQNHLGETKTHAERLENIFDILSMKREAKKCAPMEGLVMSGEQVVENTNAGTEARNLGITLSAIKVESFEIASYNGLIQLGIMLNETEVVDLLNNNLNDEVKAKDELTEISEGTGTETVIARRSEAEEGTEKGIARISQNSKGGMKAKEDIESSEDSKGSKNAKTKTKAGAINKLK